MSNSNTRRRKLKKQQHGKALAQAFAGLRPTSVLHPTEYIVHHMRGQGKSRTPTFMMLNPPSANTFTKAWFDELLSRKDPCPGCGCDRFFFGCFCNSPEALKDL